MKTYLFASTLDNVVGKVCAANEDAAWEKYINHYFSHRLSWGENLQDIREELEHNIFVVDEDTIIEIGSQ